MHAPFGLWPRIIAFLAHTVGATLSGAQALKMFGSAKMGLFSGILTLLILVLTEIIPKNAGERNAEKYASGCAKLLKVVIKVMYPLVWLNSLLVKIMFGEHEDKIERSVVKAMTEQAIVDGALDSQEGVRMTRVMELAEREIQSLKVLPEQVDMVPHTFTLKELSAKGAHSTHSRILVYENSRNNILGYIFMSEAYRSVVCEINSADTTVKDAKSLLLNPGTDALIRPISQCHNNSIAKDVLESMLQNNSHLVSVLNDKDEFDGIITFKDLIRNQLDHDMANEDDPLDGTKPEEDQYTVHQTFTM